MKFVQSLYTANYQKLLIGINEDMNKWNGIQSLLIEDSFFSGDQLFDFEAHAIPIQCEPKSSPSISNNSACSGKA